MGLRGWGYDLDRSDQKGWEKERGEGGGGCSSIDKDHVKEKLMVPIGNWGSLCDSKVLPILLFTTKCGRQKKKKVINNNIKWYNIR